LTKYKLNVSLIAVLAAQLGTSKGRYDEHSGKFPLVCNQGLIEPVGERTNFEG
jgi:hypothetical protein